MPTNRRRRRQSAATGQYTWHFLGLNDKLGLTGTWGPQLYHETLTTIDALREAYEANAELLDEMREPGAAGFSAQHAPGHRASAAWRFDLLPNEPRRRLTDDADISESTDRPPWGHWWTDRYWEPSFWYLARNALLKPDEYKAMRAERYVREHAVRDIKTRRPPFLHQVPYVMSPWEHACIAAVWGSDILTPDELTITAPWLRKLLGYIEANNVRQ